MGYSLEKEIIVIGEERRIFFKRKNIVNLLYAMALFICFFITLSVALPALAIETTKASALYPEELRNTHTLSNNAKKSQKFANDTCRSYLDISHTVVKSHSQPSSVSKDRNPAPLALAAYLGVRVALGPKEAVQNKRNVQINSNAYVSNSGHPRALAIAAFRQCQKEANLKKFQTKDL